MRVSGWGSFPVIDTTIAAPRSEAAQALPKRLTPSATSVQGSLLTAISQNKGVVHTRFMWRYLMLLVTIIPEGIFSKMELF